MARFTFEPGSERHPLRQAYRQLDDSQWLPAEQLRAWQLQRLRALVAHCKARVPYYRETLAGTDPATLPGVEALPLLTRPVYQHEFARMQAEALPPGHRATGSAYSSGTTGIPIEALQTDSVLNVWVTLFLRDLDWAGVDVQTTLAAIRILPANAEDRLLPYWHPRWAGVLRAGSSIGYDLHRDPREQAEWLLRVRPAYVLSHPAVLERLAAIAPRWPELRGLLTFAEPLTPHQREVFRRAWGVEAHDNYSCSEAGYVASQCPAGHGLHVHAESVILEVLDEAGRPCPAGVPGRAVLTVLHNYRGPFLRYDIGDEVTLGGPCPCGRGLPLLTEIHGKVRPFLRLPGGGLKNSAVLAYAFRKLPGVHQFQLVQRADESLLVRVVPDAAYDDATAAGATRLVREFMASEVPVAVERVERMPLPRGGKFHSVLVEATGRHG